MLSFQEQVKEGREEPHLLKTKHIKRKLLVVKLTILILRVMIDLPSIIHIHILILLFLTGASERLQNGEQ